MTAEEQYLFDLNGYLVVENMLGEAELEAINRVVDEKISELEDPAFQRHRFLRLLDWGRPMIKLIDHPEAVPYLSAIIGSRFRLDHDYLDVLRKGLSPIGATLHGGGAPHDPSMFYHFQDGRMYNGLTVVAYNLKDVNPGDGGFGCVPGSHKANYALPENWLDLAETRADCVRAVDGKAGSAVIFTEALTHGALPWTSDAERRTVFYKYNHPAISWVNRYYDSAIVETLTEAQKKILAPPQHPMLVDAYVKRNDQDAR